MLVGLREVDASSSLLLFDNAVPKAGFVTHDTVLDRKRPDTMPVLLISYELMGVTIPGLGANRKEMNAAYVRTAP